MFFETINLQRILELNSKVWPIPFENNFKHMMNCPVTWANMNEPNTQGFLGLIRYSPSCHLLLITLKK